MLTQAIQASKQRVDGNLKQFLDTLTDLDSRLKDAIEYATLGPGKRIRPFLIYATADMLGIPQQRVDPCAAAIECIHAYSLVHDDLPAMDDDDLRRGRPTVHIAFDEATAILSGDALQSVAFEILSAENTQLQSGQQLAMIRCLAHASGAMGMCGGQALDLDATDRSITLNELTRLHNLKTGALIRCAIDMVIICGDVPKAEQHSLRKFADAIGLAFQVHDDILDLVSSTQELGKPQGSDSQSNKSTFPKLLGLEGAQQTAQGLIEDALSALEELPYNSHLLTEFAQYIIARRL